MAKQANRQRLERALGEMHKLDDWLNRNNMYLDLFNQGMHWRIVGGPCRIDWWPSTSKLVIDESFKKAETCFTVDQLIERVARLSRPDALTREYRSIVG